MSVLHKGRMTLLGLATLALLPGCCKRFQKPTIEELSAGDPSATTVAWSMRLPDSDTVGKYSVATNAKGDIVVAGSLGAEVEIGDTELPTMDEPDESDESMRPDLVVWKMDSEGKPAWAKRFGSYGVQEVEQVAVDPSGSVLLAADINGSVTWGASKYEPKGYGGIGALLGKLDASGTPQWSHWFDATRVKLERTVDSDISPFGAQARGVAVDASGRVYALISYVGALQFAGKPAVAEAGNHVEGALLLALEPDGSERWRKLVSFPDPWKGKERNDAAFDVYPRALFVNAPGQSVVLGQVQGSGDWAGAALAGSGTRLFVSARNDAGAPLWTREFPLEGYVAQPRVAMAQDGSVFVAGVLRGTLRFDTHAVTSPYSGPLKGNRHGTVFVARLDAKGAPQWAKSIATSLFYGPLDLAVDPRGGFVLTLTATDIDAEMDLGGGNLAAGKEMIGYGMAVGGYTATGDHRWSKVFFLDGHNQPGAVAVMPSGQTVAVGSLGGEMCIITCKREMLADTYVVGLGP